MVKFKAGVWTIFQDTHAGGGANLSDEVGNVVIIEAPEELALAIFEERFDLDPLDSCDCCGAKFEIAESRTLPRHLKRPYILTAKDGWLSPSRHPDD